MSMMIRTKIMEVEQWSRSSLLCSLERLGTAELG